MSGNSLLVEPAFCSIPPYDRTLGPEVADLSTLAGFAPDAEQRLVLDAIFGLDRHGRPVAFETGIACCRQNLKTGVKKQAALGWLFVTDERLVVWSAHEWDTVKEAFRDLEELVTGSDWLRKRVKNIYRGNGDEAIELLSGSRLIFKTRTKGGGRGLSAPKVILDEAMFLRAAHMGALLPALSAQKNPQVVYGGSAGLAESDVWRSVRNRGRAGADPRLAYFDWCAPPPSQVCARGDACTHALNEKGCGCDVPANWQRGNPALGRRITADYIAGERRALPPAEFGRERMGWWDTPASEQEIIPASDWSMAADPSSEPVPPVAFACVFSAKRDRAAIGVAGRRADGMRHVELAEHREGTAWVGPRLIELQERHAPCAIVVDPHGHEASIIPELEAAGIEVAKPTATDVGVAFGMFVDGVVDAADIRHRGQSELTAALTGAATREIGDAGMAWGRRKSGVDIAPLVVVTLALWGYATFGPQGDYDARRSVHFDTAELVRLVKSGVYGPADVERIHARGLLGDADLADLDRAGIPLPAGVRGG